MGYSHLLVDAEEIRDYFMEHLQTKEENAQDGADGTPDPEDLAAQVGLLRIDACSMSAAHTGCSPMFQRCVAA